MDAARATMTAAEAAHEDDLFFRALEGSADAVALSTVEDGHILYVNDAFVSLTGVSRRDAVGRSFDDLELWLDGAASQAPLGPGELRLKTSAGAERTVTVSDEHVEFLGRACVLSLIRDAGERRRLEHDRAFLASIVESSEDAIIGKSVDGTIVSWNRGAERMYGYAPGEILGRHVSTIVPPERLDELELMMADVRAGGRIVGRESVRVRKDGTRLDVSLVISPIRDAEGRVTGISAIGRDITDRKRAEERLREAEERYRSLIERIPLVTYVDAVDGASSTLYMSPQITALTGYPAEEWRKDPTLWHRLMHHEDRERVLAEHARTNATGEPFAVEYRLLRRDGRSVWVRDEAVLVHDERGRPQFWQGMLLDITDRKRAEQEITFLAYHDKLTRLPNRAMFEELLELALARARRSGLAVAVLYADLDNFKAVNDSLGHSAGDEVIREMAARMRQVARATDVVARQGGDEFLLVLGDLDPAPADGSPGATEVAESVAERLRTVLEVPFALEGTDFHMTASVGVSLYPFDARDSAALLSNADAAMYQSKRAGGGRHSLYGATAGDAGGTVSLHSRLRKAGELQRWVLHYQPIVRADGSETVGVEALIRWKDPRAGLVPPVKFLHLAEQLGLSERILDWLLEEASRQARSWLDHGTPLRVGVNLSARDLWRRDLVPAVRSALEHAGIDGTLVGVEVAEASLMADPDRALDVLMRLKDLGLGVTMDDFGTGYSSLAMLARLPIDAVKVDGSFVRAAATDATARSVVASATAVAESLGIVAVGEGVETDDQLAIVRAAGCGLVQGYLFCPPVSAADVAARMADRSVPRTVGLTEQRTARTSA